MGEWWSRLWAPEETPIQGCVPRLKSIFKTHFRGIIGCLLPLIVIPILGIEIGNHWKTVQAVWLWMVFFLLLQPVNIPVTGLIPIFMFPMTGVLSNDKTAASYFNETIALMILAGMVTLLMNNSNLDKRIMLYFLCSGDSCQFSGKRMVFKASIAAFLLSMLSSRLISCLKMYEIVAPAYEALPPRRKKSDPDYIKMRDVVNNAIQTSSTIGSITMIHTALATMTFKAIWVESGSYEDCFNYFQYICFALPVALAMFFLNVGWHLCLINWVVKRPMSIPDMTLLRQNFIKAKQDQRPTTGHEWLSLFFTLAILLMYILRWSQWQGYMWTATGTLDATVAAMFVIILHILPKDLHFLKYITAKVPSQLPPLKPASAILWWKYVDKNTNYGYILLMGSGVALQKAFTTSGFDKVISDNHAENFNKGWITSIFLVVLIAALLANIMTSVAVCVIFMPFFLAFATSATWTDKTHLGALGIGIASSFGFMIPFLYTPAYYCHHTGNTPIRRMIRFSCGSLFICTVILWLALCFYGPIIWPTVETIASGDTTTEAPTDATPEPPPRFV